MNDSCPSEPSTPDVRGFGYFPRPYPDETIPSVIARLRSHLAATEMGILRSIYRANSRSLSPLLPPSTDLFYQALPKSLGYTFEKLISENTAINYLAAFVDCEERRWIIDTFLMTPRRGWARGISGGPVGSTGNLRFCPICRKEQISKYGECYWRLSQQLPIVLVCVDHRELLRSSSVASNDRKTAFSTPDDLKCAENSAYASPGSEIAPFEELYTLALWAHELLRGKFPKNLDKNWAMVGLQNELSKRNFRYPKGDVRLKSLVPEMKIALSGITPAFPEIWSGDNIGWWFPDLCSNPSRPSADQVLLAKFAFDRIENNEVGFGEGPWACFNPLSDHYGQDVVKDAAFLRKSTTKMYGRFQCDCGYSYTRWVDRNGSWGRPVVFHYGPSLKAHVEKAIKNRWNLKETHMRAGMNRYMFKRQARKLGLAHPWDGRQRSNMVMINKEKFGNDGE